MVRSHPGPPLRHGAAQVSAYPPHRRGTGDGGTEELARCDRRWTPTTATSTTATRAPTAPPPAACCAALDGDDGWPRAVRRAASIVAVLVLWQVNRSHLAGRAPPCRRPGHLGSALGDLLDSGVLLDAVAMSLGRVVRGMAIGVSAGLLLGAAAGLFRLGEDLIDPPLQALRLIPYVALVPFFIIWLGIGEESKFGLVALGFFPVYLHTFHGIRGVDERHIEAASSFGVGRIGLLWHVIAPSTLPQLLIGLRQSIAIAWITLVVAEQIAVDSGVGALLNESRTYLQTDVMFVCLLVYAAFGLVADLLIRLVERRTLVWRGSFRGR